MEKISSEQLQEFAENYKKAHTPWKREAINLNRNDLCACGSEKKVKKCCGVNNKYYY